MQFMNILFIGNSYTYYNDLPLVFSGIANDNGKNVKVSSVTFGGAMLHQFVDGENEFAKQLDVLIQKNKFDVCILQEQSILPIVNYELFETGVKKLIEKLKPVVEKFVLYATWGRKEGSETLTQFGWTTESMTKLLAEAYEKAGTEVGASVAYVGYDFAKVDSREIDLYNPDLTHPSYKGSCLAGLRLYKTIFDSYPGNTKSLALSEEEILRFERVLS